MIFWKEYVIQVQHPVVQQHVLQQPVLQQDGEEGEPEILKYYHLILFSLIGFRKMQLFNEPHLLSKNRIFFRKNTT